MKYVSIYKITGPDGVYVGQTKQRLSSRFSQHVYKAKTEPKWGRLRASMNLHGRGAFKIEEIERVSSAVAIERESYWINELSAFRVGYNASEGGVGPLGMRLSDEVRAIHSRNTKDRWRSPEWVKKRRAGLMRNQSYTSQQSEKGKLGAIGRVKRRPWFQVVDISKMVSIGRWQNAAACSVEIGVSKTTVCRCVKGERTHSSFLFIQEVSHFCQ